VSNFDQSFAGLSITLPRLDGGRRFATPWTFSGKLTLGKCLVAWWSLRSLCCWTPPSWSLLRWLCFLWSISPSRRRL